MDQSSWLCVVPVHSFLLCLIAEQTVAPGFLRAKAEALREFVRPDLATLDAALTNSA